MIPPIEYRLLTLLLLFLPALCPGSLIVSEIRCESQVEPLGIDVEQPSLSWKLTSPAHGQEQLAYRVLVASSRELLEQGEGDVWDSGRVESGQSQHIEYGGKPLVAKETYYWKVRTWDKDADPGPWSPVSQWTMGLLKPDDWTGEWIRSGLAPPEAGGEAAPLFRKEFNLPSIPESAMVTVHSPAYFELYVNGEKVGEDVLSPAVSDQQFQTFSMMYEVSRYLKPGANCIGLWVGKGWSDQTVIRAQLDAQMDGEPIKLGTDTSWLTRPSGYYRIGKRQWGDYGGERIVASELISGWSEPGLDTESWETAESANPELGEVRRQDCPPNRIGKRIQPVSISNLPGDIYEIDFGTCLTGWLQLKMPLLEAGTVVRMTFADSIDNAHGDGKYQHFNQISEFVSAGNSGESFQHKFNYAGFRYVIVEGLPSAPSMEDAVAMLIESDLEDAGSFACSNELLNRIHEVNRWTQRCLNLGGYSVDCPHRERWGYGDGQVATEGFMSNFRADRFYRKWMRDWRLLQKPSGDLTHSAPFGHGGGGPGWGGLLSAISWEHFLYYGDQRTLEENYETIRRYVDYLESLCTNDVLLRYGGKWDFLGDWVPPRRGMDTDNWPSTEAAELFNNCYRIIQMDILRKMATVLGKQGDAERLERRLSEIRPKVHAAFYDVTEDNYGIDEQAYYVMPLLAGIVPESRQMSMLEKLEQNIMVKNQGHLDTGMLGTRFMMEYLREIGRNDLVFTIFNQTTYPGWGYMIDQGATSFWEQWNGYYSRIHACYISPDNWLYQGLAGIQADPRGPGFRNAIIKPGIVGDVTWVRCHYDSLYGRIESNWERTDKQLRLELAIPANATATVYVPTADTERLFVSGERLADCGVAALVRMESGCAVVQIGSGHYTFVSRY